MHVLVAEADEGESRGLAQRLQRNGYTVLEAATGSRALEVYGNVDLILLDLELPDIDGLEVCRTIRSVCDTPLIALTEGRSEIDRVLGLQAGADDCLDKPYGFRELLARMDAVLRRVKPRREEAVPHLISLGPLRIDAVSREVRLRGELIEMTRKEFDLLYHLASHPGEITSREQLMAEVWDVPEAHNLDMRASRTIDTHVSALRSKLGAGSWITTIRGVGFRFCLT